MILVQKKRIVCNFFIFHMAVLLTVFGDTIVSFIPKNKNNIGNKKNRSLTCSFITYHTQSSERTRWNWDRLLLSPAQLFQTPDQSLIPPPN